MIRDHRSDFMVIQEMKMKKDLVGKIYFSNNLDGEVTNFEGASRGFLTLYNNKHFLVTTIYKKVIHCYVNFFILIEKILGFF